MYEKDHDYGNVWAAKQVEVKLRSEGLSPFSQRVAPTAANSTEVMHLNPVNKLVANGAKQFASHEDVIKKFLGGE